MLLEVPFLDEVSDIIKTSHATPLRVTEEQLLSLCDFVYFFKKEKHLRYFQNAENVLYGFCYGEYLECDFWMFLDTDYVFYDVKLPRNGPLSKETLSEIEKIFPIIQKYCFS